jgi:hypothetical protein
MLGRGLPAVIALLLLGTIASTSATVVVPAEFREIVADASLIVRGTVTDVRAVAVRGDGIDSVGTIAVASVLKGAAPDGFVSIRVPGGTIGRTRFVMIGAPELTLNEQAVFFLKRGADNFWRPIGLTMGISRLQLDQTTRQWTINAPLVAGRTASTGPVVRGDVRRKPMAVADFEALVRLLAAAQAGGGQ